MAEGFFGNLFGASPSSINSRSHIDYAGLSPNYELTDTEKSLWSKHRNHFKVNQYDDYATEGLEKGYYSLDDMYLAAIQRLVSIDSQLQEVLDSMDVKLSAKGERKYEKVKKEWMQEGANASVDWMYFHGNIGIADQETGDFTDMVTSTVVEATPEPVEEPSQPVDTETTGILGGIATAIGNLLNGGTNGDTPPPEERTMSDNEKAQIEEHIRNMDIDFKEEMRNNGVTLTNLGNNAWEEIRNAVRDGTLPLTNYNNDYLRGKLEQEGYFTMQEPADQDPLRFGDQIQDMGKVGQDDFGGKEKPPAQDPMGGPIQYDREGRPTDMPMEPTMGGFGDIMGGLRDMFFPPMLPHEEEERRLREVAEEEADLSPESGLESKEEMERKNRLIDVEKTDERFEEAHGKITQEGERAWEEVRMKYLDMGGFNYANQVQALIEAHRIPEPVDAKWEWTEWTDCRNGKQSRGTKLISEARFGGRPYQPQKEQRECEMPVEETPPAVTPDPYTQPQVDETGRTVIGYDANGNPLYAPTSEQPNPIDIVVGWIGDLIAPVGIDEGTNQDSLLPDQTKPSAPTESTPTPPPTTEIPAPVDCRQELSEWEEWSDCRYGKRSRGRSLTTYPAENGGEPCGPRPVLTEKEDCEEEPIGSLCGFGAWDSWSEWDCKESPWSQGGDWYMTRTRKRYTTYLLTKEDDYRVSPSLAKCRKEHPLEDTMENGIGIADHIEWLNDDESSGVMVQVQTERQKCPPCQEGYVRSDKEANFSQCEPLPVEETVVVDSATTQDSSLPAQTSTPATTSETPSPTEVVVNFVQQPASSGGGGGQTATTPAATTTETKDETKDDETTTEEPEEGSKALLMVGGLAVLSGIGYWAYQKYA